MFGLDARLYSLNRLPFTSYSPPILIPPATSPPPSYTGQPLNHSPPLPPSLITINTIQVGQGFARALLIFLPCLRRCLQLSSFRRHI
jgi:hypothetical protein